MEENRSLWNGRSHLLPYERNESEYRGIWEQMAPYTKEAACFYTKEQDSYWTGLYSETIKKIQKEVERFCDGLCYRNSPMYDEYPDRMFLMRASREVYESIRKKGILEELDGLEQLERLERLEQEAVQQDRPEQTKETENRTQNAKNTQQSQAQQKMLAVLGKKLEAWSRDMVDVLLYQEMKKRRRKRESWCYNPHFF